LVVLNHPTGSGDRSRYVDYRFSLEIQFFSLWRGAGEPLSFLGQSSTSSNGIASHVDCATQLRSVVRLIGAEHGKQSMQQLSHNRYDGLQPSFAAS
jgi:hypothetical protein